MSDRNATIVRIARGGLSAFAVYVVGAGLTYLSQLFVARIIGAESYGVYVYVFAWCTALAYFCALGFDVSLLRFIPAYGAEQAWALQRGVIRYAERGALAVGLVVICFGAAAIELEAKDPFGELPVTFRIGLLLAPVWAVLWIRCSVVRAFGGVISALTPDRIAREGILLVLIGVMGLYAHWRISAPVAMAGTLISSLVGLGLATISKRRIWPVNLRTVPPVYAAATWRRTALPLVLISGAEILLNRTGVMAFGWNGDTLNAGVYSLAFNVAFVVALPRTAVNALLAPTVAELFARNDRAALQIVVARAVSWSLIGGVIIALPIALFAEPLLAWFGAPFRAGAACLRILLLGQVIAAGLGPQLFLMTMTGHERGAATLLVLTTLLNFVLTAALMEPLGLPGAAIATTTVLAAWNASMALFIWRRLDVLPGLVGMMRRRPWPRPSYPRWPGSPAASPNRKPG